MGQIFVLDRRTGQPITKVIEKPVPTTGHAEGEKLSPTQPYSVGMPQIGNDTLREKDMWVFQLLINSIAVFSLKIRPIKGYIHHLVRNHILNGQVY